MGGSGSRAQQQWCRQSLHRATINQVVDPSRTHSSKEANQQERHPVTCAHMRDLNLVRLITVVCRFCAIFQLLKNPTKQ